LNFGILALILAVGLLGPALTLLPSWIAPPIVIGEIAAGVIIGRTGTGTLNPTDPTLLFLADIGFALLMFIVGTHLPVREKRIYPAVRRALIATLITVALAVAVTPLVMWLGGLHRPGVIAVLVAASSAAIVLPIVQSGMGSNTLLCTLAWVSIVDVVTVLAVPLVLATGTVGKAVLGSVLVIVGAGIVGVIAGATSGRPSVERLRSASVFSGFALDLRVSLVVLFALAWIAERFETSVLIAGFAAGAMVAALGPPKRVADQLIGLGQGFFVPLFFVVLGASIDLRALFRSSDDIRLLVFLLVAGVAVHVLTAVFMRLPVPHGLLASAQLGVPAAVATIGIQSGELRPSQAAAIVGASVITLAVASIGAVMAGFSPRPKTFFRGPEAH
jgi:Kef-type K+ transport system membrane component KefB